MEYSTSVKIEKVEGSQKMYIIFGGIAAGIGMPPFEFAKASNILSDTRVFIRDLRQNWYQSGLPGMSNDVSETKDFILSLISEHSPEKVVMIGNSMGGFAAILFSSLIPNCHAVAFSPQTFISPLKRIKCLDFRWQKEIINTYKNSNKRDRFWDLSEIDPVDGWKAQIYVSRKDRLDYEHAQNLSDMEGVDIKAFDFGGHQLVKELKERGELAKILQD